MKSLFAQLFLAIQEHIKNNVPSIKWIDQDLGQLDFYETRPAIQFPCVLIDFPQAVYSNESQLVQWADVQVNIRLAFAPFTSANSVAPDVSKEKALEYYDLENALYKALAGFTANDCVQPLIRVSAATERREDPFRVREIIYTTGTEDETAMPENIMTNSGLELNKE